MIEMTQIIEFDWEPNFDSSDIEGISIRDDVDEILKIEAIDYIYKSIQEGYSSGELYCEIWCEDLNDYLSYSGWWQIERHQYG